MNYFFPYLASIFAALAAGIEIMKNTRRNRKTMGIFINGLSNSSQYVLATRGFIPKPYG